MPKISTSTIEIDHKLPQYTKTFTMISGLQILIDHVEKQIIGIRYWRQYAGLKANDICAQTYKAMYLCAECIERTGDLSLEDQFEIRKQLTN